MIRLPRIPSPSRTLIIALVETTSLAVSLYLATAIAGANPMAVDSSRLAGESVALATSLVAIMAMFGVYARKALYYPKAGALRLVTGSTFGFSALSLLASGSAQTAILGLPGAVGTGVGVAAIVGQRCIRTRRQVVKPGRRRILVLGTGSRAAGVEDLLRAQPTSQRLEVVGYLPATDQESEHEVPRDRLLTRERGQSLHELAREQGLEEIVAAVRDRRHGALPVADLMQCRLHGVRVTNLTDFMEGETGKIMLDSVNTSWFVFSAGFRRDFLRNTVKRAFDLVASTALLVPALPLILTASAGIGLTMGRPIFYTQQRTGNRGRSFVIRKLRSMRTDAESSGSQAQWASACDDRITPLGRWLRTLRIDELPQLINVFLGDMSFVGPRPERPAIVNELATSLPFYEARHSIKPGITGWAQIRYQYGASVEDARQKLQYDLYYVKNHTLVLDLMIVLATFRVVLFGKGAR